VAHPQVARTIATLDQAPAAVDLNQTDLDILPDVPCGNTLTTLRSVLAIGPPAPGSGTSAAAKPHAAHRPDQSPNSTDLLAPGRSRIVARTAQIEGVAQGRWLVLCATGVAPARKPDSSGIFAAARTRAHAENGGAGTVIRARVMGESARAQRFWPVKSPQSAAGVWDNNVRQRSVVGRTELLLLSVSDSSPRFRQVAHGAQSGNRSVTA